MRLLVKENFIFVDCFDPGSGETAEYEFKFKEIEEDKTKGGE